MLNRKERLPVLITELVLVCFALLFSYWLMFHTFGYSNGAIMIGGKLWSDFSSHIPVIRSFSFGSNFPPEYPLFPGKPMKFHFIFYAFVGMLEKLGVRIDYALNIPSALGFAGLIIMIYIFAKKVFKSPTVGILSVLFFLFNGTLSFLYFFKEHPLSSSTLNDIITSTSFSSFGPYDNKTVSAFWNLNIYTNQRHLGLSYALALLLIYLLLYPVFSPHHKIKKSFHIPRKLKWLFGKEIDISLQFFTKSVELGILLSFFFYLHLGVFTFTVIVICVLAIFFRAIRFQTTIILLVGAIFSIPQYLYQTSGGNTFSLIIQPGYLIFQKLTFFNFFNYWFMNLGILAILMIGGVILAPMRLKKIFAAFFTLFIIGNIFQFSPEIAGNHKFFNFFMIGGNMFAAYFLVLLWQQKWYLRPLVVILVLFSILSGIIDFFPVYNDQKMALQDYPSQKTVNWILNNTPPKAVFLNTSFLFDPASIAGRKTFLGWPYFAWSAGYDTNGRDKILKAALTATSTSGVCKITQPNHLSYLGVNLLNKGDTNFPPLSPIFASDFPILYKNDTYIVYDLRVCPR